MLHFYFVVLAGGILCEGAILCKNVDPTICLFCVMEVKAKRMREAICKSMTNSLWPTLNHCFDILRVPSQFVFLCLHAWATVKSFYIYNHWPYEYQLWGHNNPAIVDHYYKQGNKFKNSNGWNHTMLSTMLRTSSFAYLIKNHANV